MNQAQETAVSEPPTLPKRVLVAEDSPVTQDLLKLILTQRGHEVDIAEDGEQALSALNRGPYDVALIDYRLPKMDGLAVAENYRGHTNGGTRARLIAITADMEGLLAHQKEVENFDQVIPKPLDVYEVCHVIEEAAMVPREAPPVDTQPTLETPPDQQVETSPEPATAQQPSAARPRPNLPNWALGLQLLRWPDDLTGPRMGGTAIPQFGGVDEVDGIVLTRPAQQNELSSLWEHKPLHLFPIIGLGQHEQCAVDLNASGDRPDEADAVRNLIHSFHQRRGQLHRDLLTTPDLGEKLLARLYVQGTALQAHYDPNDRLLARYNVPLEGDVVIREADRHVKNGFLTKDFFDRFHVCYRCSSSRLHIREECAACRSSQLREETYIHHFKCGYQGVLTDFQEGERLVCPKCRQELAHFSVDYDKPGAALVCDRCGHAESEPIVGFICMDCTAHFDSDAAATRDVFSYALTQEGNAFMQMGNALRGPGQRTLRFTDLPLDFVVSLNEAAKAYNTEKMPFTVANIAYENEREIIRETGLRQFTQARDLFLENLRNEIRGRGQVSKGHSYDFCLIYKTSPADAESYLADMTARASHNLRLDLGISTHRFGPEAFS